ncbi:MAG TPA: protein-L-isoaspartate(D-aspartate) O-methyltransferase [Burkholderiaceae bacterium]|nr:protein-L-isoaspartate(D-aspartate) O-methyltransferase [Burkholderiaceae bacterium]HYB50431.1 protein-L-isoaspartate(D-aspartate) O-methyltransferase [Burkholderiaceae bacterium]
MTAPATKVAGNTGLTSARVRQRMVERVRELGIRDARVLAALMAVPRHLFVDAALASRAYDDCALPLGHGQTMSQPYIVARSAELALASMSAPKSARILEIGTGGGYAAAVYAQIFGSVYSIERVRALHERARANLRPLRLANVRLAFGDGAQGLAAEAPFDAIIAAAAGTQMPAAWGEQLAPAGVVVAPVGNENQQLSVLSKDGQGRWVCRQVQPVRFVPLLGGVIAT